MQRSAQTSPVVAEQLRSPFTTTATTTSTFTATHITTNNMTRFRPNETPRARSFTEHALAYKSPESLFVASSAVPPSTPVIASTAAHHSTNHRLTFEFNLEDHIKKTRKAAAYMKQLHHTQSCGGICMAPYCMRLVSLLKHVQVCGDVQCMQPGCQTTKTLLDHAKKCRGRHGILALNNNNYKSMMNHKDDFCLMCTIAFTNENGEGKTPSFEDNHYYDQRKFDTVDDARSCPLICDEIIDCNRVPFQSFMSHTPSRCKTYSDSDFVVQQLHQQQYQHSQVTPPNKKLRSKSMTAASLNEVVI